MTLSPSIASGLGGCLAGFYHFPGIIAVPDKKVRGHIKRAHPGLGRNMHPLQERLPAPFGHQPRQIKP